MSESSTLPLKVAETGPILILTTAAKPLSPVFSSDWQPGMQALSTSGSLSIAQTFGRSAGSVTSPVIVIAMTFLPSRTAAASNVRALACAISVGASTSVSHRARNIKTPSEPRRSFEKRQR